MRCGHLLFALVVALPAVAQADDTSDTVPVKITGAKNMVLERAIENTGLWESLCVGECNARVPESGWYRVTGHGLRPSMPIGLITARSDGVVHLEPHPAYTSGFVGGVTLASIGPLVFLGGLIAIVADNRTQSCEFVGPGGCLAQQPPPGNAPVIGGAFSMAIGGAMTIAGVLIAILSHHTTTTQVLASARKLTVRF